MGLNSHQDVLGGVKTHTFWMIFHNNEDPMKWIENKITVLNISIYAKF